MNQVQPKRIVLVVDDQEIDRDILSTLLESDYKVLTAANGRQALDMIDRKGSMLAAVLLDLIMPVMDGYEVLQHLKEKGSDLPVLVMSQENSEESELRALTSGASDFVVKPYHASVLKHRLQRVIEMHEASKKIDVLQRDEVTGLYTKVAFAEHAARILHEQTDKEWNMIAVDIDRFKLVNESYGQQVGDQLLAYFAKLLKRYSDTKDCICARSYADHFFLLVERQDYSYIKQRYD